MLGHPDLLFPLVVFCVVTLFTPGPNNVMLMNAGLNFGLRRAIAPMLGVALGFSFLVLCVGLGLGAIFARYPVLYDILKYVGAIYLLYLAWKIAGSGPPEIDADSTRRPMSFFEAVAFQWINPKGWVMAISSVTTYAAIAAYPTNIEVIAATFCLFGFGSSLAWASLGSILQKFLHRPKLLHAFNIVMALLLIASLYPLFTEAMQP